MTSVREAIKRILKPREPLPSGIYHYQSPPDVDDHYRLHLRVERSGNGILIVNASTILHLNQTATEYAYHLINQTPGEDVVNDISKRYRVTRKEIEKDFTDFKDKMELLLDTPDLDPEIYIGFERTQPYPSDISAPYRLDCAVTYRLPEGVDPNFAPTKRVDREMTTEEWKSIIERSWEAGVPHLIFTGGEPTMHDDLINLLEYSEHLGMVTGLNTDGLLFEDNSYFESLLQTGLDHLTLVLDPENKNLWQVISKCIEADIFFAVHLTITLKNAVDAQEIIYKLKEYGLKNISLSASDPVLFSNLNELRDYSAELGLSLIWDLPVPYSAFNPVALEIREDVETHTENRAWLYIEPDGDVLLAQGADVKLGNLLTDSWDSIWLKTDHLID